MPATTDSNMGLPGGSDRIFRNPSGRTARIVPDIPGSSSEISRAAVALPPIETNEVPPTPAMPLPESDFSWAHVTGSYRREKAVEGLLYGVAIGDALGLGREGLRRQTSLRIFGKGPLDYCLLPGIGLPGTDFQRLLMTLQAILRSRSQLETFRRGFANRLRFYFLTLPLSASRATWAACLRLCLGASPSNSGVNSNENSGLVSAMGLATVMQGTGHSVEKWAAICTEVTHIAGEAVESSVLIARATYLAVMIDPADFEPVAALDRLIKVTEDRMILGKLKDMRDGLTRGLGCHELADKLGWSERIPTSSAATAIMAIYAWLTNHRSFEKAVERAILLGGDAETLGAITGGLAGIHLGARNIPARWKHRLFAWPNSRRWMSQLIKRFVDWPHGSEDLHNAPGMPPRPVMQMVRSGVVNLAMVISFAIRIPWRVTHRLFGV